MMTERPQQFGWRVFIKITLESIGSFYVATFCLAVFFKYQGIRSSLMLSALMIALYIFVLAANAFRVWQKLSIASLMLIIPIAPFIAMTLLISLIPVLQYL